MRRSGLGLRLKLDFAFGKIGKVRGSSRTQIVGLGYYGVYIG